MGDETTTEEAEADRCALHGMTPAEHGWTKPVRLRDMFPQAFVNLGGITFDREALTGEVEPRARDVEADLMQADLVVPEPRTPPDDADLFEKNSFAFSISREMALDHGLVEPTAEEACTRAVQLEDYRREYAAAWLLWSAAVEKYTALGDGDRLPAQGAVRAVKELLTLHAPTAGEYVCRGCDWSGWEGEPPEWPCRTARLLCIAFAIPLPPEHMSIDGPPRED